MSTQFLAAGDYLIDPEFLTFAVLEQGAAEPRLRLGFARGGTDTGGELQLTGNVAREVLRPGSGSTPSSLPRKAGLGRPEFRHGHFARPSRGASLEAGPESSARVGGRRWK